MPLRQVVEGAGCPGLGGYPEFGFFKEAHLAGGRAPEVDADILQAWRARQEVGDGVVDDLSTHAVAEHYERLALRACLC